MSPRARKAVAVLLLVLLALPSGLCSLFFTGAGVMSLFEHDSIAQSAGTIMLICSAVGWAFCILILLGARRLRRVAAAGSTQTNP